MKQEVKDSFLTLVRLGIGTDDVSRIVHYCQWPDMPDWDSIRVLADEMDCEIIEFSNVANASSLDVNSVPTALGASRMEQFATWLMMAGRSGSLSLSSTSSSAPKKNGNKKFL